MDLDQTIELAALNILQDHSARGRTRSGANQMTHDRIFSSSALGSTPFGSSAQGTIVGIGMLQGLFNSKRKKRRSKGARRTTFHFGKDSHLEIAKESNNHSGGNFQPFFMSNKVAPMELVGSQTLHDHARRRLSARFDVRISPHDSYYIQISNTVYARSWNQI